MDEQEESPGVGGERLVRHRRWEKFGLAAVLVVSVIGVGAAVNVKHHRDALPPVPTLPVVHVPGVTTRLVVPHRTLKAGSTMHAMVIVTNSTDHPIKSVMCDRPFAVGLRNKHAFETPNFPLCAVEFTIPIGRSTYPVNIDGAYYGCTHSGPPDRSMPVCGKDGKPPKMPRGKYQAFVFGQESVVSSAEPVAIKVD